MTSTTSASASTTTRPTRVLVVGGGYAGVLAANRLTGRPDVAVTLINPRAQFVERIRLHQRIAGTHDAVRDLRSVLAGAVTLRVASVEHIDAANRLVRLDDGDALDYDHLVYAVGSTSAVPTVPGAAAHAFALGTLEESDRLRVGLDAAPDAPVTVVGAGPSGIETATELADRGRAVTLVAGDVLGPYLHPRGRRTVAARLARTGITVLDGPGSRVTRVAPDAVHLADGRRVPSAVTVWTAGFGIPDLAARSGLRTDADGRLLTDETLTSVDDDRIVAAGDAAAPSDLPFRMSCQAAGQTGGQAANAVLARLAGTEPAPVAVGFLGQCLSLGRTAGMFQLSRRDDSPVAAYVGGRLAARLGAVAKELVCRSTVTQLAWEARRPGIITYPGFFADPRRARVLAERRDRERAAV